MASSMGPCQADDPTTLSQAEADGMCHTLRAPDHNPAKMKEVITAENQTTAGLVFYLAIEADLLVFILFILEVLALSLLSRYRNLFR